MSRLATSRVAVVQRPPVFLDRAATLKNAAAAVAEAAAGGAQLAVFPEALVPGYPAFDGANIWVPNSTAASVSVVRASNGTVLATLTGNGMSGPRTAAFDGQRILVTNFTGDSVSLWKAADLAAIGSFPTGTNTDPTGACSDGINLWVALSGSDNLTRF